MTAEAWEQALLVNVRAVALAMAAAGRVMAGQGGGRIVNATSAAARMALPDYAAYAATKAAVDSLTRSAAVALAPHGVRVNSLSPGMMDTPLQERTERVFCELAGRDDLDAFKAERTARIPLGRRSDPDEMARADRLARDRGARLHDRRPAQRHRRPRQGLNPGDDAMEPFLDSASLLNDRAALGRAPATRTATCSSRGCCRGRTCCACGRASSRRSPRPAGCAKAARSTRRWPIRPRPASTRSRPFVDVLRRFYRCPDGHALKLHPNVIGLFERLFGEPVLAHPLLIPRCIFPQRPDFTTPSHQDFPHIQGTTETMSLWLPLGDCPAEMGGLAIARGSHKDGVRDFTVSNGAGGMEVIDPLEGSWVAGPMAAGDVLIFHSLTVHKGLPNALRPAAHVARQPLPARHRSRSASAASSPMPAAARWDEIYAGWERPELTVLLASGRRRGSPTYDMQYYEQRDQIAFDLAEHGDRHGDARSCCGSCSAIRAPRSASGRARCSPRSKRAPARRPASAAS